MSKTIYIYVDDSGTLNTHSEGDFFVYAGYYFTTQKERDLALRKYRAVVERLKKSIHFRKELKAAHLNRKTKNELFKVLKSFSSFSTRIKISKLNINLTEKKSRQRYQDYALKRIIKKVICSLIEENKLKNGDGISILLYIDQQPTSTNGFYDLEHSIYEEFHEGVTNPYYGFIKPILKDSNLTIKIKYRDSKYDYLVQASDILANRVWSSYQYNIPHIRQINNHESLHLP